jgi:hypothetical protein
MVKQLGYAFQGLAVAASKQASTQLGGKQAASMQQAFADRGCRSESRGNLVSLTLRLSADEILVIGYRSAPHWQASCCSMLQKILQVGRPWTSRALQDRHPALSNFLLYLVSLGLAVPHCSPFGVPT